MAAVVGVAVGCKALQVMTSQYRLILKLTRSYIFFLFIQRGALASYGVNHLPSHSCAPMFHHICHRVGHRISAFRLK